MIRVKHNKYYDTYDAIDGLDLKVMRNLPLDVMISSLVVWANSLEEERNTFYKLALASSERIRQSERKQNRQAKNLRSLQKAHERVLDHIKSIVQSLDTAMEK